MHVFIRPCLAVVISEVTFSTLTDRADTKKAVLLKSVSCRKSSRRRCSVRKGVPWNFAKVFSCEFCEISKNTFFIEHLGTSTSVVVSSFQGLCPKKDYPVFRRWLCSCEIGNLIVPSSNNAVDTRCRFNVDTTSCNVVQRRIDIVMTSCVYWELPFYQITKILFFSTAHNFEAGTFTAQKTKFFVKGFLVNVRKTQFYFGFVHVY